MKALPDLVAATASRTQTLLAAPETHDLRPPETAAALGSMVVFAPHPDDESLGCGGLLALLAEQGIPAKVVVMTDGSRSHPTSLSHPAVRLAALREEETLNVGSSRVDLQACKLEYSIVSPK